MAVAEKEKVEPKFWNIHVKTACYLRIRQLANQRGTNICDVLDDLTTQALDGKPPQLLPKTPLEDLREHIIAIENAVRELAAQRFTIDLSNFLFRKDKDGNLVPIRSSRPAPQLDLSDIEAKIDSGEIQRESEEHYKLLIRRLKDFPRGDSLMAELAKEELQKGEHEGHRNAKAAC